MTEAETFSTAHRVRQGLSKHAGVMCTPRHRAVQSTSGRGNAEGILHTSSYRKLHMTPRAPVGRIQRADQLLGLVAGHAVAGAHEARQRDGRQVAHRALLGRRVLQDLGAQVGALDGAQVLLVGLAVAGVLVQHVGVAGLDLGLQDREPQLLGADDLRQGGPSRGMGVSTPAVNMRGVRHKGGITKPIAGESQANSMAAMVPGLPTGRKSVEGGGAAQAAGSFFH